jgi:hypothetical protein
VRPAFSSAEKLPSCFHIAPVRTLSGSGAKFPYVKCIINEFRNRDRVVYGEFLFGHPNAGIKKKCPKQEIDQSIKLIRERSRSMESACAVNVVL